jgi:hypothetical protein
MTGAGGDIRAYGLQCWNACDEQVAGPLREQLGQCFRLSGADPDGNENWRLAPRAVDAVRQLRADYDETCDEAEKLRERVAELDREVERQREIAADAVAGGTRILDIAMENGGLSLSLEGGGAQLLAEILAKQYADSAAVNYLQLSFTSQHSAPGESFVVTVQRVAGKTAHELRAEAEAELDRLRAECESLTECLRECADDLESEVKARASGDLPRRIERDLEPARRARELLAARAAREG